MKTFLCHCGNKIHFENTQCLACGRKLGFLPEQMVLSALEPVSGGVWRALAHEDGVYRMCRNYHEEQVCNWMVPVSDKNAYCRACRLNHMIPNLSEPRNRVLWARIEQAKRRLLYSLYSLGLPVAGRGDDPAQGLAFEFLQDLGPGNEFMDEIYQRRRVVTGHRLGLVTINVAEADASQREEIREKMQELYRTLLGHFRHEVGHYYWDRLIAGTDWLQSFRMLFGDERADYDAALKRYYEQGALSDWQSSFISAYATAHPWEDWAETWAHYLHIVDTLETAHDFGFAIHGQEVRPPAGVLSSPLQQAASPYVGPKGFDDLLADWTRLTSAMNALNRSMGQPDAYPFVLSPKAADKLRFVHRIIAESVKGG